MNNIRYIRESLARISSHSPTSLQGIYFQMLAIIEYTEIQYGSVISELLVNETSHKFPDSLLTFHLQNLLASFPLLPYKQHADPKCYEIM